MNKHSDSISAGLKINIVAENNDPSVSINTTKISLNAEGINAKEDIELIAKIFDVIDNFNPN